MRSCRSGVLTPSSRLIATQACVTARARTNPKRTKSRLSTEISRFSSTLSPRKQPVSLRSSVTKAMPRAIAARGESTFTSQPSIQTRPQLAGEDPRELAPHHHANELISGEVTGTVGADVSAVAQHGYLVRDLEQLVHSVGDVENAGSLRLQVANDREQVVRVPLGERGGG